MICEVLWECVWIEENEEVAGLSPVKWEPPMCSEICINKWCQVWPEYNAEQHQHMYLWALL